jgi:hypothetical protein
MTTLVVIDQFDEEVATLLHHISGSYRTGSPDSLILINLTDNGFDTQFWAADPNVVLISGFDIYAKIESEFSQFLEEWLLNILIEQPILPFVQYSRLSEQNFSHELFQDLKQLHLIDYMLQQSCPGQVIYVSDREIAACVERLCAHHSVTVAVHRRRARKCFQYKKIRPIVRTFGLFFYNIFAEVFTLLLIRLLDSITSHDKPARNEIGIYAAYPANWDFEGTESRYRYTNDLDNTIKSLGGAHYLLSVLRRNADALIPLSRGMNACKRLLSSEQSFRYSVLEGHGSLKEIAFSYGNLSRWINWFRNWRTVARSGRLDCFSIPIPELLTPIKFSIFREIPKNMYTELCTRNWSVAYTPRHMFVPLYELLEGRAITSGSHFENSVVIGLQHGVMYNLQKHRVVTSLALINASGFSSFVPNIIAAEGGYVKEMYSAYQAMYDKLQIVGAPRIFGERPTCVYREDGDQNACGPIIVFGDMYAAKRLTELAINLAKEFQVIFRCHPGARNLEEVERISRTPGYKLFIEKRQFSIKSLTESYRPTAGICCMSGVSVELAMLGVPVILIKSNLYPIINPLIDGDRQIPLLDSQKAVSEEIQSLMASPKYRKRRATDGHYLSQNIVEYTGKSATDKLGHLINEPKPQH